MLITKKTEDGSGPAAGANADLKRDRGHDPYAVALLVLILVMAILYTYFFYQEDLPFRNGGFDTYAHMGFLRSVEDSMGLGEELAPDLFPGLYGGNERLGINYVAMALIAALPGASDFSALYIFGLLGIIVSLSGIYSLTRALSGSSRAAFLAAILSLLLCSTEVMVRGSSLSFVEILTCAHYASVLTIGLMMHVLALNVKFLDRGDWRHYLLQLFLAALVFNIHLLTGMGYFLALIALVAVYAAWERRLTRRHILLLSLIPAALILASIWPLYHWWVIFQGENALLGWEDMRFSSFGFFLQSTVIFFIGLPFLLRKKRERIFLLLWTLTFALVALSFLFPFTVAYHWRLAYVMRIPLIIGLALGLGEDIWKMSRHRAVAIPTILAVIGAFVVVSMVINVQRFQKVMDGNDYSTVEAFMNSQEGGSNLVALPKQGYMLMGISNYNVYSIQPVHDERYERLLEAYFSPKLEDWEGLLQEYEFDKALVGRSRPMVSTALLLDGILAERNDYFDLYEVEPDSLDTEIRKSIEDNGFQDSEVVNGFIRFEDWAYFQQTGGGMISVDPVKEVDEEGEEFLRVSSDDPGEELIFINRGYIEVDPTLRYRISADFRISPGDPGLYLVFYQYTEASPEDRIASLKKRLHGGSEEWTQKKLLVGPEGDEGAKINFSEETRYVKIGVMFRFGSTGQIELDLLDISPA